MVDETKCLKAYQRSAADQEESLPNELRPATTLVDCCWYLCAELCTEENIYRHELKISVTLIFPNVRKPLSRPLSGAKGFPINMN